ncbi:MAG: hypothetical protein IPG94_17300 [Kineosporiaceae bacterium]|nr:hypothetical protein [Kineosporiaceae bacterium]
MKAPGAPDVGGLVAALAGDGGARLAAAVQTAVGDLAALSVPDPTAGVEVGCLADLPDRAVTDLAAAGCRLATWAKLAATVAAEELVTRWENGAADEQASPVNAQPVFPDHDLGYRAAIAETATTCVIAESTVAARVDALRELPARLPGLWHLLATGEVDIDTARLVHTKTRHLPGETLTRLEPHVLVKVVALTYGQLAAWLDRIVAKADPRDLAEQIADNIERRRVAFRTAGPGTGRMTLTASVADIEAIQMTLLAHASAGDDPDQPRPTAAIRADIITDLITGTHTGTVSTEPATEPEPETESLSDAAADDDAQAEAQFDTETRSETEAEANDAPDTHTGTGTGTGTRLQTTPTLHTRLARIPARTPRPHHRAPVRRPRRPRHRGGQRLRTAHRIRHPGPARRTAPHGRHRDLAMPDHRRHPRLTHPRHHPGHRQGTPRPGPHRHRPTPRTRPGPRAVLHVPRLPTPGGDLRGRPPRSHSQGGPTCECNLHPLCKHHHRLRERGFTPTLIDPGTGLPLTQWVTPTGRTIRTESEHPPF